MTTNNDTSDTCDVCGLEVDDDFPMERCETCESLMCQSCNAGDGNCESCQYEIDIDAAYEEMLDEDE